MRATFKTCVALLLCLQVVSAKNFITLVQNCRDNHIERFNECVVEAFKKLQHKLADGTSDLNLHRMDPLDLDGFNITHSQGPVNFKAEFTGLQISGLRRLDLQYFDVNLENRTVRVGCTVPGLTVRGKYNITGQVFQLPVQGTGPFLALLEGVVAQGKGGINSRNGVVNELESLITDIQISKFKAKVDNLYSGNEVLQDTFTHFIEHNSNLVLEEVRPGLMGNFNGLITSAVNAILGQLPTEFRLIPPNSNRLDKHRARTLRILAESKKQ